MKIFRKAALWLIIMFYFIAGIKHFTNPEPYLTIIPPYLPYPETLSYLAGFFEIAFALLLFPVKTRKYAGWGIILMLIALMPCHIYMIQKANISPFLLGNWTITPLIAWIRIPFQFVFILWAFWCSKMKFNLI
jgi:uncharacterized membrane protein